MVAGRDHSTIFGKKAVLEIIRRGIPMPRLERSSPKQNLIGAGGGNRQERFHKLIHANCGRSRFRPMPSSMPVMTANPRILTEHGPAWFLPTPWVVKIATSPTSECGPTTRHLLPKNTGCLQEMRLLSRNPCLKAHLGLTKTPCPENWPTSFRGELPISSTCRAQTMRWMLLAPRQWRRSWMHVACFRHDRST